MKNDKTKNEFFQKWLDKMTEEVLQDYIKKNYCKDKMDYYLKTKKEK